MAPHIAHRLAPATGKQHRCGRRQHVAGAQWRGRAAEQLWRQAGSGCCCPARRQNRRGSLLLHARHRREAKGEVCRGRAGAGRGLAICGGCLQGPRICRRPGRIWGKAWQWRKISLIVDQQKTQRPHRVAAHLLAPWQHAWLPPPLRCRRHQFPCSAACCVAPRSTVASAASRCSPRAPACALCAWPGGWAAGGG